MVGNSYYICGKLLHVHDYDAEKVQVCITFIVHYVSGKLLRGWV